jgi:di/tricarboxylate transporter
MNWLQILWALFFLEHAVGIILGLLLCGWGIHIAFTPYTYKFPVKTSREKKAFRMFLRGVLFLILGLFGLIPNIFLDHIWKESQTIIEPF